MKVYLITNLRNGKKYVGITRRSLSKRLSEHIEMSRRKSISTALASAIRKYGVEAFEIKKIGEAEDWVSLCDAEKDFIKSLNTKAPFGYNMTDGGDGVAGLSEESMQRMRDKCRSNRHTPEAKMKISIAGLGRKHTEEAKARISAAHKGKYLTAEHRAKLSAAKLGKKRSLRSEEHKRRISEGLKAAHKRRKAVVR